MIEVYGDLFTYATDNKIDFICFTSNGIVRNDGRLVMGEGIAKAFRDGFPGLDLFMGRKVRREGNNVLFAGPWKLENPNHECHGQIYNIVSFPTKHHYKDPSPIDLIFMSAKQLKDLLGPYDKRITVVLTRPGCGYGGQHWPDVKAVLEPFFDDRFYIIHNGR